MMNITMKMYYYAQDLEYLLGFFGEGGGARSRSVTLRDVLV